MMPNDKPKRPRGRPKGSTKPDEQKADVIKVCLKPGQRSKFKALGGSEWLQNQIEQARL